MNILKVKLLVILFGLWFLGSCNIGKDKKEEQITSQQLPKAENLTSVNIAIAEKKAFEYLVHSQGKIEPKEEVSIRFNIQGILSKVNKKNGAYIKKGEILAMLDDKQQRLSVRKAQLTLIEKQIAYNDLLIQFKGEYSEESELSKEVVNNLKVKSGLLQAELSLEEATLGLENMLLRAPFSGVISDMTNREGDLILSGDVFCILYNPNILTIKAQILEDDLDEIIKGQKADIKVLSYSRKTFGAVLTEINPRVNDNGLINIKLELLQSDKLLPGMNASVVIKVPKKDNIIVPKDAVVVRSGRKVIFTVQEGHAKWNYVVTGMENGTEVEIPEGIKVNDSVITTNNLQLAHDAPVKVEGKHKQNTL